MNTHKKKKDYMICPNAKICNCICSHKEMHNFITPCTRICERLDTNDKVSCVSYHELDILNTFNNIFDDFLEKGDKND